MHSNTSTYTLQTLLHLPAVTCCQSVLGWQSPPQPETCPMCHTQQISSTASSNERPPGTCKDGGTQSAMGHTRVCLESAHYVSMTWHSALNTMAMINTQSTCSSKMAAPVYVSSPRARMDSPRRLRFVMTPITKLHWVGRIWQGFQYDSLVVFGKIIKLIIPQIFYLRRTVYTP